VAPHPEPWGGVEVGVGARVDAVAEAEVERACGAPEQHAGNHRVPVAHHGFGDVAVRDAPTVGELDHDVHGAGHRTGERDPPGGHRPHRGPRRGAERDAPVAGAPRARRGAVRVDDRCSNGRFPARCGTERAGGARREQSEQGQGGDRMAHGGLLEFG
jgi:hypothetical protein